MDIELRLRFHDFNELRQNLAKLLTQFGSTLSPQDMAALKEVSDLTESVERQAESISTVPPQPPKKEN